MDWRIARVQHDLTTPAGQLVAPYGTGTDDYRCFLLDPELRFTPPLLLFVIPALVIAGLAKVYPELSRVIDEHTSVDGHRRLKRLEDLTTAGAVIAHRHDDFDDFLDSPLADVLAMPCSKTITGPLSPAVRAKSLRLVQLLLEADVAAAHRDSLEARVRVPQRDQERGDQRE